MSYYRAALAAARLGNLTAAERLARCSAALGEDAPYLQRLLELLKRAAAGTGAAASSRNGSSVCAVTGATAIKPGALKKLRSSVKRGKIKKALKVKLPKTSRCHTIRGLLYYKSGRMRKAKKELARALLLDTGNDLARRALARLERRK